LAYAQRENLATGELIAGTFAELAANWKPALIYLAAIGALNALDEAVAPAALQGVLSLGILVAYFVGQYLLFETMLRNAQLLPRDGSRRFFRFTGLAFVVLFAVLLATQLFVIPGIIVGAKWIMAPSLLVAGRHGVFGSLGESWSLTKGNTLPIALAAVALVLVGFVGGAVAAVIPGPDLGGLILLHGGNLLLVGLSVTVYRRLNQDGLDLSEVFA
jgi:hypothetical protein